MTIKQLMKLLQFVTMCHITVFFSPWFWVIKLVSFAVLSYYEVVPACLMNCLASSTETSLTSSGTGVLVNSHIEHSLPIIPAKSVMENHVFVLQFRLGIRSH